MRIYPNVHASVSSSCRLLSQFSFSPSNFSSFYKSFLFCSFFSKARKKKICYLKYPCGSLKNKSLVYVSSKPTEESAEDIATAASSQSSPKTMLEGDTGWRQNRLNEPGVIGAPRAPHFAPINCVCQSVKVQGPLTGNKEKGQKGLVWLTSAITSQTSALIFPFLECSCPGAPGRHIFVFGEYYLV